MSFFTSIKPVIQESKVDTKPAFATVEQKALMPFLAPGVNYKNVSVALVKSGRAGKGRGSTGARSSGKQVKETSAAIAKLWNSLSQSQPFLINPYIQYNKPHYVCENVSPNTFLAVSSTVPAYGAQYFTAGQINQSSTLAGLFDQYKIIRIEFWCALQPTTTAVTQSQESASNYVTAVDYDDASNPSSYGALCDFQSSIQSPLINGHYHDFTPHVAVASYTGTFDGYTNVTAPWIDASSLNVQHYGIKVATEIATNNNNLRFWFRLHTLWRAVH